jgi:hypothetical protein
MRMLTARAERSSLFEFHRENSSTTRDELYGNTRSFDCANRFASESVSCAQDDNSETKPVPSVPFYGARRD